MREKRIKLSRWAKDNDVTYRTAVRHYHEGRIEGAYLDVHHNRIYVRLPEAPADDNDTKTQPESQ